MDRRRWSTSDAVIVHEGALTADERQRAQNTLERRSFFSLAGGLQDHQLEQMAASVGVSRSLLANKITVQEQVRLAFEKGRLIGLNRLPGAGEAGREQHATPVVAGKSATASAKKSFGAGFIDHPDGANIRTLPAERPGSQCLTTSPLPSGTRVFVTGSEPQSPGWLYVTAFFRGTVLRYVQGLRITTALPEPTATLYPVKPGDRLEPIAARI